MGFSIRINSHVVRICDSKFTGSSVIFALAVFNILRIIIILLYLFHFVLYCY